MLLVWQALFKDMCNTLRTKSDSGRMLALFANLLELFTMFPELNSLHYNTSRSYPIHTILNLIGKRCIFA